MNQKVNQLRQSVGAEVQVQVDQIQVRTMALEYAVRALAAKSDLADNYLKLAGDIHAFLTHGPREVADGTLDKVDIGHHPV